MNKKSPKLTLIECDDYAWLFINGELVEANHSINWPRIIKNYKLLPMNKFYIKYEDKTYPEIYNHIEETGDLPKDLSVFGLGKDSK